MGWKETLSREGRDSRTFKNTVGIRQSATTRRATSVRYTPHEESRLLMAERKEDTYQTNQRRMPLMVEEKEQKQKEEICGASGRKSWHRCWKDEEIRVWWSKIGKASGHYTRGLNKNDDGWLLGSQISRLSKRLIVGDNRIPLYLKEAKTECHTLRYQINQDIEYYLFYLCAPVHELSIDPNDSECNLANGRNKRHSINI